MYKQAKILFSFLLVIAITLTGCKSNNSPTTPASGTASSSLLMKAHSFNPAKVDAVNRVSAGSKTFIQFPVSGGIIDVQMAMFSFKNLVIEENSGFDGEQQGDNNSGDQNEGGPEVETPDITAPGPFSVDLSNGTASIGNFDVYPGTFKKVNFKLEPNAADPYLGKTIVISGTYTAVGGTAVPFKLRSAVASQIQLPLANGGIVVAANSTVSINIVFDLPSLFSNIDLSTATVANGEILIDTQNNSTLLSAFENNLTKYVDAEDGGHKENG